jgi:hypothetical protein
MKKTILAIVFLFSILTTLVISCGKEKTCYDTNLYEIHKNDICTEDWLGVTGCDGLLYSNECDANRQGIKLK